MTTFILSGFRRKDIFIQRQKDEVGFVVDADSAPAAVEIARKAVGSMASFFGCTEIEFAPDELKRRITPTAMLETCITRKPGGIEYLVR